MLVPLLFCLFALIFSLPYFGFHCISLAGSLVQVPGLYLDNALFRISCSSFYLPAM